MIWAAARTRLRGGLVSSPSLVGVILCAASVGALLSWRFHSLVGFFTLRGSPPVAPDASVAFFLAGINVHYLSRRRSHWLQRASGILFLTGGLALPLLGSSTLPSQVGRFLFGLAGFQFDGVFPRITLTASIGFGLWGAGLLASCFQSVSRAKNFIAAAVGSLLVSLACTCLLNFWFGFSVGLQDAPGNRLFQMSVESSLLFLILGASLCAEAVRRARTGNREQRSSVETITRMLIAVTLLLLFVGVNFTLSLGLNESVKTKAEVARVYQSAKNVDEIVAALREAESGQRGFLLTGDSTYLNIFRAGLQRVQDAERNQHPRAQEWSDAILLGRLTAKKTAELLEAIRLKEAGDTMQADALVRSGRGLATMERIEDHANHIGFVFSSLINEQNLQYAGAVQMVTRTILASYALAITLLGCAAFSFNREIGRRSLIEGKLRAEEMKLASRIEERTAELKASETRYRAMLEQSPIAIHVLDRNGNSLSVNSAFENMAGVTSQQMQGYNIWADPQPAARGTLTLLKRAFAGETTSSGTIPQVPEMSAGTALSLQTAKAVWLEVTAYPVKNSIGEVQEVVLLCNDVTDRELALKSVRESELKFKHLADLVPQIVWTAKPDGSLDYYNHRWYAFSGGRPDEEQRWLEILHPDERTACLAGWANSVRSLTPYALEQRLWDRSTNEYRWHLARAVPVFDDNGQVKRWFGTTTDIHEQKAAEEILEKKVSARTAELRQANDRLQAREDDLRRSLSEREILFREVHHRVKNNLQVISSLLRMQSDSLQAQPAAAMALDESRRRVLSMAMIHERLYANQSVEDVDFADYAHTLVKDLIYSYSLPGRQVTPVIQVDQVRLNVDQAIPCGLILNELVTNALKYAFTGGTAGEIRVSLRRTRSGEICLIVSDNGIGLPEGFNWRASSSLGLPIVDILGRQLDGSVKYESCNGAAFTIRFPDRGRVEHAA